MQTTVAVLLLTAAGMIGQKYFSAVASDLSADAIRRAVAGDRDNLPFLEVRPFLTPQGPRLAHWLMGTKLLLLAPGRTTS